MGKTLNKPSSKSRKPKQVSGVKLTRLQQRRIDSFRQLLREREAAWSRLTPAERQREERDWDRFKKSVNEERALAGARPVFID